MNKTDYIILGTGLFIVLFGDAVLSGLIKRRIKKIESEYVEPSPELVKRLKSVKNMEQVIRCLILILAVLLVRHLVNIFINEN
jgi:hypothetical protein